ncbi:pilus assembly protein PilP [Propionivibrio soli]|uniref:pilus assembly protein PilP n=1 Tax=Propionivibrio soli TaxID=2976531 RepID=UPI0021E9512C|nr:pilus assembly protein PilP [Propionivibrio soli]
MRISAILIVSILLAACSGDDHQDLRQWMAEAAKGAKGKIPPLPQVKPYEPVPYDVSNIVDPFKPAKIGVAEKKGSGSGVQPDMDRPREPLEAYPLESLKYVGVMTKRKASYAIIQVDGSLYQVKTGNYIGQNFGVITRITESEVALKELVQDSAGDWVERTSALLLQDQGGTK